MRPPAAGHGSEVTAGRVLGGGREISEILFVELLGGLGDVLISLPAVQALGRSHPGARLTVLTFAPGGELLEGDPLIDEVVRIKREEAGEPDLARRLVEGLLAGRDFDLVVSDTTYGGIDRAIRASGAPRTVTNLWRTPPPDERVGERFVRILLDEGLVRPDAVRAPLLHLAPEERRRARERLKGPGGAPLAFLCPDAGMAVKRWPKESFVRLGRDLGRRHGAAVVVPVGADGAGEAAKIAAGIREDPAARARVLPRGTLRELAAAASHADLFVAADTGPARIAAALGVPTVTLFGPSWHGRYGQPSPHANLQGYPGCPERVVADFTAQRCWYGGVCPLDRWDTCLEDLSPERVLAVAGPLLAGSVSRRRRGGEGVA